MMLNIEDVSCRYRGRKKDTLHHLSFSLEKGEMILVAGRSGCGKSTLIKAITGFLGESGASVTGQISLDGKDCRSMTAEELGLLTGTVYQTPDDQLFAMTCGDETAFALENRGEEPKTAARKAEKALARVGLSGTARKSIHELSGGQRQRLALASVLVTRPSLLILDEPVSQMDPQGVKDFLDLLQSLNQKEKMTIFVAEHRVNEMAPWFPRLAVMDEGHFVYDGPTEEAWAAIGDPEVYGLREPQTVKLGRMAGLSRLSSSVSDTAEEIRKEQYTFSAEPAEREQNRQEGDILLSCKNLSYRYDGAAADTLCGLDFTLRKGTVTALMGFNGAGKSTLMNILGGLERQTAGDVLMDGKPLIQQQNRIGYLRQEADLMLLTDTVQEELTWKNRKVTEEQLEGLLAHLHLRHYRKDFPLALSKGQRLRTVLGALLVRHTDLLLLDEPTTGQDQQSLNEIKRLLLYAASEGRTVFFCTHDAELTADIADQVIVLASGHSIGEGTPGEILGDRDVLLRGGLSVPPLLRLSEMLSIPPCITAKEVMRHVHAPALGGQ